MLHQRQLAPVVIAAIAAIAVLAVSGCASSEGSTNSPGSSLSASTPCAQWAREPTSARESYVQTTWPHLSARQTTTVVEYTDAFCHVATSQPTTPANSPIGDLQETVNAVVSGTFGPKPRT